MDLEEQRRLKKIFSNNLQRWSSIRGIKQIDVMNKFNLSSSTVSDWYNGKKYPRMDVVQKLAFFLDIELSDLVEEPKLNRGNKIPIFAKIPAGIPIELIEDVIDYEELDSKMFTGDKEYFGVRVSGDSMYPEYRDKDILIVLKTEDCESGQDCIVMINGNDGTFKRVKKTEEGIILQPLNPNYEIKFYSNKEIEELPIKIIGIVKEIRRTI